MFKEESMLLWRYEVFQNTGLRSDTYAVISYKPEFMIDTQLCSLILILITLTFPQNRMTTRKTRTCAVILLLSGIK